MKCIIIIFICLFFFNSFGFAQERERNPWISNFPDNVNLPLNAFEIDKIESAYDDKAFLKKIYSSKALMKEFKDILRNRVKIEQENIKDISSVPHLSSVKFFGNKKLLKRKFDSEFFNPLLYDFDFSSKKKKIYRVDRTNYLIIINPKILK